MNKITKIDKFYYVFGAVLLMLSILVIFTLRTVFDGLNKANTIDQGSLEGNIVRVDKNKLDEAIKAIDEKEFIPLDLR